MTIDRRYRLPLVFIFLFGFKAGFHSVTQIFQGPVWGGILLGLLYAFAASWFLLLTFRISNPPRTKIRQPVAYSWPVDPIHQEYLTKLDSELSVILRR